TVLSATAMTALTPEHASGAVTVTVRNPDTQSGSCVGCFTYVATLSVLPTSVASGDGPTATWSGITTPTSTDWVGLFPLGAANSAYIFSIYTGGAEGEQPDPVGARRSG